MAGKGKPLKGVGTAGPYSGDIKKGGKSGYNIENIKDKIIESAIVNWFEDEDVGIEKVWNYFRAI